jgi:dTDP-4-dehydrorhamnose reductase
MHSMPFARILVTGITSIHGWPIFQRLGSLLGEGQVFGIRPPKMAVPRGLNCASVCIADSERLASIRKDFRPTHVVHCAGVCDLDVCEQRPGWAARLNMLGARSVAEVFGESCRVLYASADLVFSGNNPPAGGYAESHPPDPVSVAGRTIAAAEREIARIADHCIVRLGLPIGASVGGHAGAVDFVAGRLARNLPVTLFHDEWRSCIECATLAEAVICLLASKERGLYHCGGPAKVSLFDLGRWVVESGGYSPHLLTTRSRHEEIDGPPRIGDVSLDSSRLIHFLESRDPRLARRVSMPVIK